MRFVGIRDCQLDEKKREEGEDGCLDEADKCLKHHKWYWYDVWCKIRYNGDKYFPGEDIAKETEGEGYKARHLGNEFDDPNCEK